MFNYLVRRVAYALPILLGVNLLTFFLFFFVNPPDAMARRILGQRNVTPAAVEAWKREHGYHLPRLWNAGEKGVAKVTQTVFYQKSVGLLAFDFGRSDRNNVDIGGEISRRMWPSLGYAVPTFLLAVFVEIVIAMLVAFYRGTSLDWLTLFFCVVMMSISAMFYIIGGQWLFGVWLKLTPVSGYAEGFSAARFLAVPVLVGMASAVGGSIRFNRTVFLEEIGKDYVRTARAKGLAERAVLFVHVLKNAMIPILTSVVFAIPFLFIGSLTTEAFFGIPGLGGFTIEAIQAEDFAIVRAMVYLGSVLYIVAQILTDVSYTLVDPRVRLEAGSSSLWSVFQGFFVVLAVAVAGAVVGGLLQVPAVRAYDWVAANWNVYVVQNLCVALLIAGAAWFAGSVLPREPWRTAVRQLRGHRLALAAFAVLCGFVSIGLLDSVSWRDALKDPSGAPRRDAQGKAVLEPVGKSVLDRLWGAAAGSLRETTYSAPLAKVQFSKNLTTDKQGKSVWEAPALEHPGKHILGTDKVGDDVFFQALKGVRTGLVIGGLTVLIAIPFAVLFGVLAGYFGGWVDDAVQYFYTTLDSIPSILLIVAFVMLFGRGLVQLCVILGITSWAGLCRLVRAETLKLREMEYAKAAETFGVSTPRILFKHIVPNLMHLVTISAVLQFSGLVLAETVLAYVGVGVGAGTGSWGNMINDARLELSRDPVVWWNLAAAFVFMLALVLPANLFGDSLRDALDPRLRER